MEKPNASPEHLPSTGARRPAGERQSYLLLVIGFLIAAALPYLIHPPVAAPRIAPATATS
jgi:hypothetical protein